MDEATDLLIQRVLDGDATPADRAALDALAADDPDIATARSDYEATVALLTQVETVAPPADLKRRIMASLPAERYARAPQAARPGWRFADLVDALRDAFTARPAFGYAYAVALGAVVGIAAYVAVLGPDRSMTPPDAYGTLVAPDALASSQTVEIDLDAAPGTVRLAADGEHVVLDLELVPQAETEVRFAFDPAVLAWQGLVRVEGAGTVRTAPGEVRLTLDAPARYRFVFAPGSAPAALILSLVQSGTTRYERTLTLGPNATP